jgi:hypothetical protein
MESKKSLCIFITKIDFSIYYEDEENRIRGKKRKERIVFCYHSTRLIEMNSIKEASNLWPVGQAAATLLLKVTLESVFPERS